MKQALLVSLLTLGLSLAATTSFAQEANTAADDGDAPTSDAASTVDTTQTGSQAKGGQAKGGQTKNDQTKPATKGGQESKTNTGTPSSTSTGTGY